MLTGSTSSVTSRGASGRRPSRSDAAPRNLGFTFNRGLPGYSIGVASIGPYRRAENVETNRGSEGILSQEMAGKRDEIIEMLKQAYFAELETVINYVTNSINPDGVRAQEIKEALEEDIQEELGHAQQFAQRIKELYRVVPRSMEFKAQQHSLQPAEDQIDVVHVIKGVLREYEAEGLA